MLAAMPTAPDQQVPHGTARPRDRDDACPGVLRLHAADDGALARIRIPGGVLTARQAETLGTAAARLGDGEIHLTSRGNAQLRGLGTSCGAELEQLLTAAGLLPSAAHERVRNVVASPLSGLDGRGHLDVRPWLRDLDALLCASGPAQALSGRFLFALDDGRGDVSALAADVTLRATPDGGALLGLGRNAPVRVPADTAARAALLAAEVFVGAATTAVTATAADLPSTGAAPPTAWRVTDLPDGGAALSAEVARRLAESGTPATPPGTRPANGPRGKGGPALGIVRHPQLPRAVVALSVLAPLGRLTAGQWRALVALAGRTEDAELRLTPWRGVVVPGVHEADAQRESAALAATGLVTDPRSPWMGVGACVGRPGCAKSLADVRADAAAALPGPDDGASRLPVYWSGCARGCGRPRGDRVDVVATPGGYRVDVVRDGTARTVTGIAAPTDPAGPGTTRTGTAGTGTVKAGTTRTDAVGTTVETGTVEADDTRTETAGAGTRPADLAATVAAARRGAVSR